jgi:hypothetical protein
MTAKGLIKTIIALVIIGAGATIGWAIATSTNPYAPGNATTAPVAAATANNAARASAIPTFTPSTSTNTTPGANAATGGQAAPNTTPGAAGAATGQGQRAAVITGTVVNFDKASQLLTVKDAQGKSQEFTAANARVTRLEKLSADDFGKALANGTVLLTGEKGSDGTYNAASLVSVEATGFGGGAAAGANGTPGTGPGNGGFRGNVGTPGAGATNGTPGARGTGGNPGGNAAAGFGGANGAVIVRSGTLQGNKFTGTSFTGEAITATISNTTVLEKQVTGTLDDLKPGANVSVTSRTAAAGGPVQVVAISLT